MGNNKNRKKKRNYKYIKYKIYVFAMFFLIACVIGIIGRVIPGSSGDVHQTEFPIFNMESMANGSYFHDVSLWFCDTFPFSHLVFKRANDGDSRLLYENALHNKILFGRKLFKQHGLQMILNPSADDHLETLHLIIDEKKSLDPTKPMLALTFDDGPNKYTDRLLDILIENDSKATFYLVGSRLHYFPEIIQRMGQLNMEFGNHTYDHKYLSSLEGEDEYWQLEDVDAELREMTGKETVSIRPPGGNMVDVPSEYIDKPLILWSIDTLDWKTRDAQAVEDHILAYAYDGAIILMHDLYESTVDAMEVVIPALKAQGYELVTVSELAKIKGYTLEAGKVYKEFPLIESR